MGYKQATDWDVTLSIYGTEEVPQDVIEDTLKWILEMNGGIEEVAHIDAQPKNPTLMSERRSRNDSTGDSNE